MIDPHTLLINGRFLTRALSGVDRVAIELIRALATLIRMKVVDARLELAIPADCTPAQLSTLADIPIARIHHGRRTGHLWEQTELHRLLPKATLLSLCNTGPLWRRDQLIYIHDAQVFLEPGSYSRAFRTWYKLAQPILARRSRAVVTNSRYSLEQLERFGVVPPGRATIVPLGADHILAVPPDMSALPRFGLAAGNYVLALGNLAPHKNLAMLMRAAAARPPGSLPVVIAGGGIPRVFQDAGLVPPEGVILLGRVKDAELRALFANARLFAFPSLTEGFGIPPLEAMACGCPVIATSAAAVPEICGDAARLVDPRDERAWTQAIISLAADAEACAVLVARGRARAALFTWHEAALALAAALKLGKSRSTHRPSPASSAKEAACRS